MGRDFLHGHRSGGGNGSLLARHLGSGSSTLRDEMKLGRQELLLVEIPEAPGQALPLCRQHILSSPIRRDDHQPQLFLAVDELLCTPSIDSAGRESHGQPIAEVGPFEHLEEVGVARTVVRQIDLDRVPTLFRSVVS